MTVLHYYCSHLDLRSLQTHNIFGNILYQLIWQNHLPAPMERQMLDKFALLKRRCSEEDAINAIKQTIQNHPKLYMIFDGIDECADTVEKLMLDFFTSLLGLGNPNFHLLVTCREESRIWPTLKLWPHIRLDEESLRLDIIAYVKWAVKVRIQDQMSDLVDERLEHDIIRALTENSHGM